MNDDDGQQVINIVIVMPRDGEARVPMVSSSLPARIYVADEEGNVYCDFRATDMIDTTARGMAKR